MKVKTFDMLSDGEIEGTLTSVSEGGLFTVTLDDGRQIVRHSKRCLYDKKEFMDVCWTIAMTEIEDIE